jgi:hypothetical protein
MEYDPGRNYDVSRMEKTMRPTPSTAIDQLDIDLVEKQLNDFLERAHFNRHVFFNNAAISENDIMTHMRERMHQFKIGFDRLSDDFIGVPKIVHRLWITSVNEGFMPPPNYIKQIASQAKGLSSDYLYIFWCNSDEICGNLTVLFADYGAVISVRNFISVFRNDALIPIIQHFVDARKYVLAADVTKIMVLERFGGAYGDLGVQFGEGLLQLTQRSDAAVFLDSGMFLQPAFMALCPRSNIARIWSGLLKEPEVLSAIVLKDANEFTAGHEVWLHGGVGFTVVFLLFQPSHYRVLILPPQGAALQTNSLGSWYRDGNQYGNVILKDAKVTHLDVGKHRERIKANIEAHKDLPSVSNVDMVRFEILSGLQEYYWLK